MFRKFFWLIIYVHQQFVAFTEKYYLFPGGGAPFEGGDPVSNGSLVPAYHLILTLDIFSMPNFKPTILAE